MSKTPKSMTVKQIVAEIIKEKNEPLTAADIAQHMLDQATKYEYVEQLLKEKELEQGVDVKQFLQRHITSLYCQKSLQSMHISATSERPRRFYYDNSVPANAQFGTTKRKENEKDLYPILMQFCKQELNIDTLRLNEKNSTRLSEKKNDWLHADIVGFEDLMNKFQAPNTKECIIEYSCERGLLYSFEVKDGIIDKGNLRKYFFQTVSNSSWANFSYLVAEGINDATKEELQLLCESFKIGFIQLNRKEPEESEIVIQAPKTALDWNMIDRIAQVNSDFQTYLNNISLAYRGHNNPDIKQPEWSSKEFALK